MFGAVMGLVFVGGFFLTLVAPSQLDKSSFGVGKPDASETTSSTPNDTSPGGAIVENKSLDLQPH